MVVVDFFVAGAFVVDFLVVAAVDDVLVVVVDSFLLAHDVIKPKAARTAMDVIRDCFISWWLTSAQNVQPGRTLQALFEVCREADSVPTISPWSNSITYLAFQRSEIDKSRSGRQRSRQAKLLH